MKASWERMKWERRVESKVRSEVWRMFGSEGSYKGGIWEEIEESKSRNGGAKEQKWRCVRGGGGGEEAGKTL